MYAETGLMFPYFQSCSHEVQQLEDYCRSLKSNRPTTDLLVQGSLKRTSIVSDYDLGGEGDLFNAPEPILEETAMGIDPAVAAVISMMSSGEDILSSKTLNLKAADIESIQSEVFYECEKGMLAMEAMEAMETSLSDILDIKIPNIQGTEEVNCQGSIQKSVSSGCLSSMEDYWLQSANPTGPNFFGFPGLDLGMRRAYSDGDIKTLGNVNNMNSPLGVQPNYICNHTSEERLQKLSRYRNKKTKRNFGRKIKYACRKALADSQPRIRGRFAKTE